MGLGKKWDIYKINYINSGMALRDELYKKAQQFIVVDKQNDFYNFLTLAIQRNVKLETLKKIIYGIKMLTQGVPVEELKKSFKGENSLLNIALAYKGKKNITKLMKSKIVDL